MAIRISRVLAVAAASRRRAFRALGLLWVIAGSPAFANPLGMETPDRWAAYPTVGVLERVTLRVHWHESLEALREAATGRDLSPRDLHGFSVLSRNKGTGEYVCDVYVMRMSGALVDNDRTVTFGHEALHCFGFGHD